MPQKLVCVGVLDSAGWLTGKKLTYDSQNMEQVFKIIVFFSHLTLLICPMSYLRSYVSWWLFMNIDISFGIDKTKKADHYSKTGLFSVEIDTQPGF